MSLFDFFFIFLFCLYIKKITRAIIETTKIISKTFIKYYTLLLQRLKVIKNILGTKSIS